MDFEFQESDIVFTDEDHASTNRSSDDEEHDYYSSCNRVVLPLHDNSWARGKSKKKKAKKKKMTNSSPIDVPETFIRSPESYYSFEGDVDEEEVVPPHVIVGRRVAARMASSMCFHHGRRLKGRQLKEVRNSVLRMTGFLES